VISLLRRLRGNLGAQLIGLMFRALSVLIGFGLSYYVGQRFGAAGSGVYGLITQTAAFFATFALGGLDFAVTRELSAAVVTGKRVSRASLLRLFLLILSINLAFMLVFAVLPARLTLQAVALPPDRLLLAIIAAIMLGRSFARITSAFLLSQGHNLLSQAVELVLGQLIVVCGLLIFGFGTVNDLLVFMAAAVLFAAMLAVWRSLRLTATGPDTLSVGLGPLIKLSLPMWGLGVALNLADWYALAVVSTLSGLQAAGVFRVAVQIGQSLMFGIQGMSLVFSAQISRAKHQDDRVAIARMGQRNMLLNLAVVTPPLLLLMLFAPEVLGIVGPEFVAGQNVMRILLAGQFFFAILLPSGIMLALMDHGAINLRITLATTGGFLVLAPLMFRLLDLEGVAIAMIISMQARNLLAFYWLRRLTGINQFTGQYVAVSPSERA